MAELADALASGASVSNDVQVQLLSRAPEEPSEAKMLRIFISEATNGAKSLRSKRRTSNLGYNLLY